MSKRFGKRKEQKQKYKDCQRNLIFFRNETIRLRKMLKDTATKGIQNLGTFDLIPKDGKPIPLMVRDNPKVKL